MATVDDRTLLSRHVAGDPEAFGELVRRHRDRLWAVALRTTSDTEEAADALQDALTSAFRRAETFRGDAAVTTWLHRIVVNACLDLARRRKVRHTEPLPDDDDQAPPTRHEVVAESAEQTQRQAAVLAALRTLAPEQRAALVLVDMEGYSVHEAARMLECAPGTVKSRCSRGRVRLLPLLAAWRDDRPGRNRLAPPPEPEPGAAAVRPTQAARSRPSPRPPDSAPDRPQEVP
ncbi:MAG: RNA polymerase sigma factor SigM [Nocardioidaceae bacterium]|nr:RNA polymerase sigma factor SigM [Nocardioidaceae bacterium]